MEYQTTYDGQLPDYPPWEGGREAGLFSFVANIRYEMHERAVAQRRMLFLAQVGQLPEEMEDEEDGRSNYDTGTVGS